MDYSYLHEAEDVWLVSETLGWCAELWPILQDLGFTLDDDVFAIDREGKLPLWQSRAMVSVYVLRGEREVYDEHSQWDRVKLRYLMATLPGEALEVFVAKASTLADRLGLQMRFHGHVVSGDQLRARLQGYLQELRAQAGEPGSRDVAAMIESTYPRRS